MENPHITTSMQSMSFHDHWVNLIKHRYGFHHGFFFVDIFQHVSSLENRHIGRPHSPLRTDLWSPE